MERQSISPTNRNNWLFDAGLFLVALLVFLTSIYFLYLPSGGYQGGRNPAYGLVLLFPRAIWDDLHTWSGIGMILGAMLHLSLHWNWVKAMGRRVWRQWCGKGVCLNGRGNLNLWLNLLTGLSFFLASCSGIYFLIAGSDRSSYQTFLLLSRVQWDLLHTWSGVVFFLGAILHIAIHWRWIVNVSAKMMPRMSSTHPQANPGASAG